MPHDCKGRLIERGDIVRGKGYNIKHEIVGEVLTVVPDSDSCNVQIATARVEKACQTFGLYHRDYVSGDEKLVVPTIEYGAAKNFEVIQKGGKR